MFVANFESYGKIVRDYSGTLSLRTEPRLVGGPFRLVQYPNADILLECVIPEGPTLNVGYEPEDVLNSAAKFTGMTDEQYQIEVSTVHKRRSRWSVPFTGSRRKNKPTAQTTYLFSCKEARISNQSNAEPRFVRFSIVNLSLQYDDLVLKLPDLEIEIGKIEDYKDVHDVLGLTRGIDVTCEAVVPIQSLDELPSIQEKVNDLCTLLSLAQGTLITWINYDVVSEDRQVILTTCRNALTRNLSTLYLINPDSEVATKAFIEASYGRLAKANEDWNIRAVIHEYIESKLASSVLEGRGLRAGVCIEMLKHQHLLRHKKENVIPTNHFEKYVQKVEAIIASGLATLFDDVGMEEIQVMAGNVRGLNY